MYKKILLPTDGSKFAKDALKHALFIASKSKAEIIAISVVDTNHYMGLPIEESIYQLNEALKKEAEQHLKEIKELAANKVKISTKIAEGSPANEILKAMDEENVDLVVMGSSGKIGFEKFLLGSVADKVVKNAKYPVLIVH
jgi:nucleotide-binding universal stress UspA family protein